MVGLHHWGPAKDYFPPIPSEEDCAHILYNRIWPNYPYRCCAHCQTRQHLPKTYVSMQRSS